MVAGSSAPRRWDSLNGRIDLGAAPRVIADDGSFKSADFGQGKTFSFTFTKAGRYTYSCHIHPDMKGTVIVQ